MTAEPLLRIEALVAGYESAVPVVDGVSICAGRHEIVAILGPNGAGKSTLIKAIAGVVPTFAGRVYLEERELTGCPVHEMIGRGVGFVPQTDNVFAALSVEDNLRIAASTLAGERRAQRISEALGAFPELARQRRLAAGRLSGGQRQLLAIARALMSQPRLLLLDEPSAGLAPAIVLELFQRLQTIRDAGVGVVLVEQNVRAALAAADRAYVLVEGRNRFEGTSRELAAHPGIAALYLGGHHRTPTQTQPQTRISPPTVTPTRPLP